MKIEFVEKQNLKILTGKQKDQIAKALREFFPGTCKWKIILRLEKVSGDGTSRWIMNQEGLTHPFFLKIRCGVGEYQSYLGQRDAAMNMSLRAQQGIHECLYILGEKATAQELRRMKKGIRQHESAAPEWIIIEIQHWYEGGTLLELLEKVASETILDPAREAQVLRVAEELAAVMQKKVHTVKPTRLDLGLPENESDVALKNAIAAAYRECIYDILDRINVYLPPDITHPIISPVEQDKLQTIGRRLVRRWSRKGTRLCGVHGDVNLTNILKTHEQTPPQIRLIDFSPRVQFGEPRWDDGRLIADLMEVYLRTAKPIIWKFIDTFIKTSETTTGDRQYRQGLCLGFFSMLLLKLYPKGRPIRDKKLARRYFEMCMKVFKAGTFSTNLY